MEDNEIYTEDPVTDDESFIEERKELIEELFEKTEAYIQTNVQLVKLKAADKLAKAISGTVSTVVFIVIFLFFFLMINIGVAMWIGAAMAQPFLGFMVVGGFYGLLTVLFLMFGKKMIKNKVSHSILTEFLK